MDGERTPPETGPGEERAAPDTRRRRAEAPRLRFARRWLGRSDWPWWRALGRVLGATLLVIGATVALLFHWQPGQDLVLRTALDRAREELVGELEVGGIRSGTLLTGATLNRVVLADADGRRVLEADSIRVRYSVLAALAGAPPLRSITLWGPVIEIVRETPDGPLNIERLVRPRAAPDPMPDSAAVATGQGGSLRLGLVSIRDGTLRLLLPAETGTEGRVVRRADGTLLRSFELLEVDLDLEDLAVDPDSSTTLAARVASLTADVGVLERPIPVREVFGALTLGADGIAIRDGAFRLPATLLRGDLAAGPEQGRDGWVPRAAVEVDGWGALSDFRWLDPRLPEGRFRGRFDVRLADGAWVDLDVVEVQLEASAVTATGSAHLGEGLTLRDMRVTASPLLVERLEPWFGFDVPFDGWLSGQVTLSGTPVDLSATGRMTLVPTGLGAQPTIADFNGIVHTGADPGATGLEVRLERINYAVLGSVLPSVPLAGSGRAALEVEGRASTGLQMAGWVEHATEAGEESNLAGGGVVRRLGDGAWLVDVSADLSPLAMAFVEPLVPSLRLEGGVRGSVTAVGRVDDLNVTGEFVEAGGTLRLDARLDLSAPSSAYRVSAVGEDVRLGVLFERLPDDSRWNGTVEVVGSGFGLDSMDARFLVDSYASRFGPVDVDTLAGDFRIHLGALSADTVVARAAGVAVNGRGGIGVAPGSWGSAYLVFETESLVGLRPLLMGVPDTVVVREALGELEREFLRATGVDPDTLPSEDDLRLAGAVSGSASVSGEIASFDVGLLLDAREVAYRRNEVGSAKLALTASGLPEDAGTWGFGVTATDLVWEGRYFSQGGLEATMTDLEGSGRVELRRSEGEQYRVAGDFDFRTPRRVVNVQSGQIQIQQEFWNVVEPSRVAWDGRFLSVDSLRIERGGQDPMHLVADGTLARGERSDFHVALEGLHLDRIAHVGQLAGLELGGHADLEVSVTGPAERPVIDADFEVDGARFGTMQLTRLDGSLRYRDRSATVGVTGWDGTRDAIRASGVLPVDLSLGAVEGRILDRPMDFEIRADSLDAAIALSYLTSLEQVLGTVTGEIVVHGTPVRPEPEGRLTLSDGEWTVEAIGVRHGGVDGEIVLHPNRTVDVELTARRGGFSRVRGTVLLDPVRDPTLDLELSFDRFQAVDRLDLEGIVTGDVDLQGSYRRPVATGTIIVDEATVYVDEFQRAAGIVDLSDPLLFERGLGVDTTALLTQPLVAGLRNPFFDNLRVDVDLSVPGNTWLRSIETNVEMQGDLEVAYDRSRGDLVLVGELEAVRGSHLVLGRTFEVVGGTVSFIGRPGFDPDLNIEATARILRRQDEDLVVSAHVGGRLVQPVVTLSTEEVATSEADIISYLVFGQASGELGQSQAGMLGGLSDNAAISTAGQAGFTYVSGALANQFGASLAQTSLLDYVSIQSVGTQGDVARQLWGRTQLEAGRYLGRKTFVVLVFRPLTDDTDSANFLGGARVQIKPVDEFNIDLFVEDRFLRSGSAGFSLPGLHDDTYVYGFLIFRDWGY